MILTHALIPEIIQVLILITHSFPYNKCIYNKYVKMFRI
jgi:hypothetical protein